MLHNIRDLAIFEKLTTISRINSTFELVWHLDLELSPVKTVINVLFRNVITGEYVMDEIAPEFIGYCGVGSFFKGGKKLEERSPNGIIRDISINVTEDGEFSLFSSVISDSEYDLNFVQKTKDSRTTYFFANKSKKQVCMVFKYGANKVVIPCSVIAAKYYMTSHSMRVQLFSQNLHGLYEEIFFDDSTATALIILHRNARNDDAKRIARFAFLPHAKTCWDNVMNSIRSSFFVNKDGREYSKLIAKIPVVQQDLAMTVRCHEAPNHEGSTTILVHEILDESSNLPYKFLYIGRRSSATPGPNTLSVPGLDTKTDCKMTIKPPSKAYKGHWVKQFNVPHNPIWDQVEFEQVELPACGEAQSKQVTEEGDGSVSLSTQRAKGIDPKDRVAGLSLVSSESMPNLFKSSILSEFRDMVSKFETTIGLTCLEVSRDLEVPCKGSQDRKRFTLRESYDNTPWNRRHYLYVLFKYNQKSVCLVEFDQTNISCKVGTYVLVATCSLNSGDALQVADYFVHDIRKTKMEMEFSKNFVSLMTKQHHQKPSPESQENWRKLVLDMVI